MANADFLDLQFRFCQSSDGQSFASDRKLDEKQVLPRECAYLPCRNLYYRGRLPGLYAHKGDCVRPCRHPHTRNRPGDFTENFATNAPPADGQNRIFSDPAVTGARLPGLPRLPAYAGPVPPPSRCGPNGAPGRSDPPAAARPAAAAPGCGQNGRLSPRTLKVGLRAARGRSGHGFVPYAPTRCRDAVQTPAVVRLRNLSQRGKRRRRPLRPPGLYWKDDFFQA